MNRRFFLALAAAMLLFPLTAAAQAPLKVALVKMPYVGERNTAEKSAGPDYVYSGVAPRIEALGCAAKPAVTVALNPDQEKAYGEWNRLALANGELAKIVAQDRRDGYLPIGLLANCSSSWGMLAGLQHSGPSSKPLRVGLIYFDAHGDYNTPETTLSGMLGGMPVAIAAGLALTRMRQIAGLDPALPQRYIVESGVRDTDPLEQELLDRSEIEQLSVADIRARSEKLHRAIERLSEITDAIYVHVDMDVLDPAEVPGHRLRVKDGPSSAELAAAIAEIFKCEKAAALGVASTPFGSNDPDGISRTAAHNLILGALTGARQRR